MKRASTWGIVLVACVVFGGWLWTRYFTDEARIRSTLRGLLEDMSFGPGTGNFSKVAKFQRAIVRFTDDIVISIDQVIPQAPPITGRDELHTAIQATFAQLSRCEVKLHDVVVKQVTVAPAGAKAAFTASVTTSWPGVEFTAQEFEVRLRKNDRGEWLLAQITAVRTLKR